MQLTNEWTWWSTIQKCSHARNFEFAALNVTKPHTALLCVKAIIKDVLAGHTVAIMVIYCLTKIIACVHQ